MSDPDEDREQDEERESRRPRVVDKRVSARGASQPPPTQVPPGTEPPGEAETDTVREPIVTPPPTPESPPPEPPPAPEPPPKPPAAADTSAAEEHRVPPGGERVWTPEQEAEAQRAAEEMAKVPSREWVLNVAVTLANVGGIKLQDGQLEDAQLAIDAFAGMIDKIESQMGDAAPVLRQTLAQLQMAYAQAVNPPPQSPAN
jgi:hypothetical protein